MKKLFLLLLTVLMIFSLSACEESKDNAVYNDGEKEEIITSDITVDEFFEKVNGYWGASAMEDCWEVVGFYDKKIYLFDYPGHYWITDGNVKTLHIEEDGTIVADIVYLYPELGGPTTKEEATLRIRSNDEFKNSLVLVGDSVTSEYVYMGETFEQMEAYVAAH
ncbi:MAG: hypothetical protein E7396_03385 [Ruminococcaceae bacterium]|nr:hypothetical protein [Oscillospiraceae bacterium]